MIQFLGNIEAKADAKGRVFIPATFRKQLQAASEERLVLRKDVYQDCLVLYPESVWFATQNQLRCRLNKWNAKQQMIFRQFVSDAEVMTPDGNGRILLPKRYLQMAGIQSDVRFIGFVPKHITVLREHIKFESLYFHIMYLDLSPYIYYFLCLEELLFKELLQVPQRGLVLDGHGFVSQFAPLEANQSVGQCILLFGGDVLADNLQ